jgi:hypothetical protein
VASSKFLQPVGPLTFADGAAIASTTLTEANPTPAPIVGAPVDLGARFKVTAFGRYTSTATPGTIVAGLYIGPPATAIGSIAVICVTAALTVQASQTNRSWRLEGELQVRAVGAGTAATILGLCEVSNITSNGTDLAPATAPATATFDSTVANSIRVGLTASVATGSWQCHYFGLTSVN